MCKLIAMSSMSCKTLTQASKLVLSASKLLGASQRDGFGYAVKTSDSVFIERYLNPQSCSGMGTLKASRDLLPATLQTQLVYGNDYDQHGIAPSKASSLGCFIAHGRTATCGKNIANTHPFTGFKDGKQWTIAHNGVVDWSGEKLPLQTTCDSEHILNCFLHLNGEQSFAEGMSGYAAVIGINPQGELFALRDDRAPLYVTYCKELSLYILCTDENHCKEVSTMVIDFNKVKDATVTVPMMIAPYVKHTFHANGEISSVQFPKFQSYSSRLSQSSVYRSLGSAGAVGYASNGGNYWDDEYYGYGSRSSVTSPTTLPSNTPPVSKGEMSAEMLDEYHRQQSKQYHKNSRKPWKHNK